MMRRLQPRPFRVAVIVVAWMALAAYVEAFNATHGAPLELAMRDWVPGAT
jgi:hypothetical protein